MCTELVPLLHYADLRDAFCHQKSKSATCYWDLLSWYHFNFYCGNIACFQQDRTMYLPPFATIRLGSDSGRLPLWTHKVYCLSLLLSDCGRTNFIFLHPAISFHYLSHRSYYSCRKLIRRNNFAEFCLVLSASPALRLWICQVWLLRQSWRSHQLQWRRMALHTWSLFLHPKLHFMAEWSHERRNVSSYRSSVCRSHRRFHILMLLHFSWTW